MVTGVFSRTSPRADFDRNSPAVEAKASGFRLEQSYPNPFNSATVIRYFLPVAADVSLKLYYPIGREVRTLVRRQMAAGHQEFTLDASNLSTGVYFYRFQAGSFVDVKKMLLMR